MSAERSDEKYHDGTSPAAWTTSIGGMVGGLIIAIGAVTGPNWPTIFAGIGLFIVAAIVSLVLVRRGLGNGPVSE
ncbi:MAG TPA: HGxxPAAW family protein [Propionibacteriaceae bacterium]|nr:HGxxPAAW family protein [Propionibacteriaceae bacterium]